ncbi:MAG: isopeptide-forming domain-containing fimbrial protein [Clostridia bacterium]|nr:isopeptide-forming domain-containing fimbrial protein [Clostridia bacterium]
MMLLVSVSALAATIENKTDHSYDAYQIFAGTHVAGETTGKLGVTGWGSGINGDAFLTALKSNSAFNKTTGTGEDAVTENVFKDAKTAADVASILGDNATDKSDFAKAFALEAEKHLKTEKTAIAAGATTAELLGYYLLVDTQTLEDGDAKNLSLLEVTGKEKFTIEKKYDKPSLDKDIIEDDANVEAADKNIGDTITYELRGTLPSNLGDFTKYYFEFSDTLSKGQAYQGDIKVYLNEVKAKNDITGKFTIKHSTDKGATDKTDGASATEFSIKNEDILAASTGIAGVKGSDVIIVRYTAILTKDATVGSTGNENKAKLTYSSNPNYNGDGEKKDTPEDKTLVFTYELDTTKVDGAEVTVPDGATYYNADDTAAADASEAAYATADGVTYTKDAAGKWHKAIEGAEFKLYRMNGTDKEYVVLEASSTKVKSWTKTIGEATVLTSAANTGLFEVSGLDAGTYYLVETKAPTGYNLLNDPVKVVIAATITGSTTGTVGAADDHDKVAPALTALTIAVNDGTAQNGKLATGEVKDTIANNGGNVLPSTGGIGTTIFYVAGSILVLAAAILLITKRRMGAND